MDKIRPGQPKISSIIAGIALFLGILLFFRYMGEAVKVIGAPFLYLPTRLGLVDRVDPSSVVNFRLNTHQTELEFNRPGRYTLYTADLDLLEISLSLEDSAAKPWLVVQNQTTHKPVEVVYVKRGLYPFDSLLAPGRSVFTFEIQTPGVYLLRHPARKAPVSILPDTVTGKEAVLWLAYLIQIGLILFVLSILVMRNNRRRFRHLQEIRNLKRIRGEEFWKEELERQTGHKKG